MYQIVSIDFNYRKHPVYSARRTEMGSTELHKHMNKNLLIAVPFGLVAVAAFLLSSRFPVTAESVIGWASVGALLAVAMLDYRIFGKRRFSRS